MSNPRPSRRFRATYFRFSLLLKYKRTTFPYFDNLTFEIFDAVTLNSTSSRPYGVLGDFDVSIVTLMQNILQALISTLVPLTINFMKSHVRGWLKVPNIRNHCSLGSNVFSAV